MKINKVICFLFLICTLVSYAQIADPKKLVDKWEWIKSSGGFAGTILTPKSENYTIQIEFTKNNVFKSFKDNVFSLEKKYKVSDVYKSIYTNEKRSMIQYIHAKGQDTDMINVSFEFKGKDTLILKEECHDCYIHTYIRKK